MDGDISQSPKDLLTHLEEQMMFLEISSTSFDNGFDAEAKRLAVTLRVLLHDTRQSHSLLSQLGSKGIDFYDTSLDYDPRNKYSHGGLVAVAMGPPSTRYVAMLDDVPTVKKKAFEEWWNQPVFVDKDRKQISRKELVLAVANKDGGAHIDPSLDQKYAKLSRFNSLGWTIGSPTGERPMEGPERAAIRQITHEVIKTLKPGYEKKIKYDCSMLVAGMSFTEGIPERVPLPPGTKVGRNEKCPCGSDKKYKKCHGRSV